jgi:hypothetical protein
MSGRLPAVGSRKGGRLGLAGLSLFVVAGCSVFGIDARPGIEYVTPRENQTAAEPMYTRPVPGTTLIKRWPKRLGEEYGYAPWERKPAPRPAPLEAAQEEAPATRDAAIRMPVGLAAAPQRDAPSAAGPAASFSSTSSIPSSTPAWQGRGSSSGKPGLQLRRSSAAPVGDFRPGPGPVGHDQPQVDHSPGDDRNARRADHADLDVDALRESVGP